MINKKILFFSMVPAILLILLGAGIFGMGPVDAADRVQPVGDEIVIVIDPGHGGDNLGTIEGHTQEKEMTLVTALAMARELEQYDNVRVYLTRTDDRKVFIKDRAEFAASVGADFLFSLHYNASENHTLFGSEVWVSCVPPYNAYGYQFGYGYLTAMSEKGLFVRGVKTRIDDGRDYYGIIRESAARFVPAVIIEHCHVDEERDEPFIEEEADWEEFGRLDALSVAKYFGLKSSALGLDFSGEAQNLQSASAEVPVRSTLRDETPPDVCVIELTEVAYDAGRMSLTVCAADYDSPLINYDYSIDGGQTWSRREIWPGCNALTGEYTDTFSLNLLIPDGVQPDVIVRAYNLADLDTQSNVLHADRAFGYGRGPDNGADRDEQGAAGEEAKTPVTEPPDHSHKSVGTTTFMPADGNAAVQRKNGSVAGFLKLCLLLVLIVFFGVLVSQTLSSRKRKKRYRDRK